jgi:hypothetical protein
MEKGKDLLPTTPPFTVSIAILAPINLGLAEELK